MLVLKVVVPALDPESLLDPPQPESAATSKRVATTQPKVRAPRATVTVRSSVPREHQDIVPMG